METARHHVSPSKKLKAAAAVDGVERDWSKMLPDILQLISDRLPLFSFLSFRAVCKSWRCATSGSGRAEITSLSKATPWILLYHPQGAGGSDVDDTCYLYDGRQEKYCTLELPQLRGARCVHSSESGWVLAQRDDSTNGMFFFNPFSLETISGLIPNHPQQILDDDKCVFSSLPTSNDWEVHTICWQAASSSYVLRQCRAGDKVWNTVNSESTIQFIDEVILFWVSVGPYSWQICPVMNGMTYWIHRSNNNLEICKHYSQDEPFLMLKKCPYDLLVMRQSRYGGWLERFGGESGFKISTCSCPTNKVDEEVVYTRTVGNVSEMTRCKNSVRAVWLEPPCLDLLHDMYVINANELPHGTVDPSLRE